MAKIETEIADGIWNDVSRTLELNSKNAEVRQQVGRALGGYKADLINRSDIHPNAVRIFLADCQRRARAFEKVLAPLATCSESGARLSASRRLCLASGLTFDEMNAMLRQVQQIALGCKKELAQLSGRKGPTPQTSRDILMLRLDKVLGDRRIQISNKKFAKALQMLLAAAGSNRIPDQVSLERAVGKVRGSLTAGSGRK